MKKKQIAKKKLIVSTEKVRKLDDAQVDSVGGGRGCEATAFRSTCPMCQPGGG